MGGATGAFVKRVAKGFSAVKMAMRKLALVMACSIAMSVAIGDTNVVAAQEKTLTSALVQPMSQHELALSLMVSKKFESIDKAMKEELKVATCEAKNEYKDRYDALMSVHEGFMSKVNIWFTVLSVITAILGVIVPVVCSLIQYKNNQDAKEQRKEFAKIRAVSENLRRTQVRSSFGLMTFAWIEFIELVGRVVASKVDTKLCRESFYPIYRMVDALTVACESHDEQLVSECVAQAASFINKYYDVVTTKGDLDERFKVCCKECKVCSDATHFNDLKKLLGRQTVSLTTVLKFLNEFGIKRFGEVS